MGIKIIKRVKESYMIGIYKFTNKINGNSYIGQSINVENRKKDHISRAFNNYKTNIEYNTPLHKALRKYGLNNFDFEILEKCEKKELNNREQYWIKYYNTFQKGYNLTSGGDSHECSLKIKEEMANQIKDLLLNTNKTYEEIHRIFNISTGRISEINTGKIWFDNSLNYPLREKKEKQKQKYYCIDCNTEITRFGIRCVKCAQIVRRNIQRPDRETLKHLIRVKTFVELEKIYKVTTNAIKKWCINYNLPSTKKEINSYSNEEWKNV